MWFYKRKGFTLLELMIVIIIIGILASVAVPRFITAANKAREAEARSILGSIRSSQMRYYLEWDAYTATIGNLDLDLSGNPTKYYTYSSLDGSATSSFGSANIGQAAADQGFSLSNFTIDEEGNIE